MSEATTPSVPTGASVLLRLFWLLGGNAAIYLSLATIALTRPPLPSWLDAIIAATLALMLVARHADIVRHDGRRFDNDPATLRDWNRWATLLVFITLAVWVLAHLVAGSFA